jgi:hypothetical protein
MLTVRRQLRGLDKTKDAEYPWFETTLSAGVCELSGRMGLSVKIFFSTPRCRSILQTKHQPLIQSKRRQFINVTMPAHLFVALNAASLRVKMKTPHIIPDTPFHQKVMFVLVGN